MNPRIAKRSNENRLLTVDSRRRCLRSSAAGLGARRHFAQFEMRHQFAQPLCLAGERDAGSGGLFYFYVARQLVARIRLFLRGFTFKYYNIEEEFPN